MCCIFSRLINFTTSNVLINNSAFADFRGKVNGLGQVLAAIGRFAGPSIGSNIFAWSIAKDRPFPFHYGFTYYILGIMMVGISFYIYLLPKSVNNAKGKIADDYKKREQELAVFTHEEKQKEVAVVQMSATEGEKKNESNSSEIVVSEVTPVIEETKTESKQA